MGENLTLKQKENFIAREAHYYENVGHANREKRYTAEEIVLKVLADNPDNWYYTWELMGQTKYGWLSHATHATLRKAEQKGLIHKDYIGKYVVYTHKNTINP